MSMDERFCNIKIMHSPMRRANLRKPSKRWALGGLAIDDGENTILLGKFLVGNQDIVESWTIAELISHEILHHITRRFIGNYGSHSLDRMLSFSCFLDNFRIYIQRRKVNIINAEVRSSVDLNMCIKFAFNGDK